MVGAQFVYLALWIAGGLPPLSSPLTLSLAQLQGRWTREDGQADEVRGMSLCPLIAVEPQEPLLSEHPPSEPCSRLIPEGGRLTWLVDDLALDLRAYRRWGREYLDAGLFGLTFSRPVPAR